MHAWIDSFYIDGVVKGQIETAQLMDKIPALYILLVILGILELMMVKSSGIRHIKMFSKNKQTNAVVFLMPALVIYVWEGFIRRNILSEIIKNGDSQRMTVNEYLTGYYIGNKIFFNWSWMIMLFNSNHSLYNYTIRYYQGIKRQGRNVGRYRYSGTCNDNAICNICI